MTKYRRYVFVAQFDDRTPHMEVSYEVEIEHDQTDGGWVNTITKVTPTEVDIWHSQNDYTHLEGEDAARHAPKLDYSPGGGWEHQILEQLEPEFAKASL